MHVFPLLFLQAITLYDRSRLHMIFCKSICNCAKYSQLGIRKHLFLTFYKFVILWCGDSMKTVYDVRQLLKSFGIFVYIGDRLCDLELMELELTQLYQSNCISIEDYKKAVLILRKEARIIRERKGERRKN